MTSIRKVKAAIELSTTTREIDELINKTYGFKTVEEKVAFIKGMFDIEFIGHIYDKSDENAYWIMLEAILASK